MRVQKTILSAVRKAYAAIAPPSPSWRRRMWKDGANSQQPFPSGPAHDIGAGYAKNACIARVVARAGFLDALMPFFAIAFPMIDPIAINLGPLPLRWYA